METRSELNSQIYNLTLPLSENNQLILAMLRAVPPLLFLVDFCGERNSEQFDRVFSAWKSHAIHAGVPVEFIQEQSEKTLPHLPFVSEQRITELLSEAGFTEVVQFYKALTYVGWMAIKC